ncbi:MAG: response regulator transcription factor [Proteobacteria bacterium]|nr:response regulator transcription factor [Pseudomonadota bacterium]MBU4447323.1 response regulator transcription factor [Pseudomonadota bacterium]MCG2773562.1 response regulator transcription factor [Desulfobacterales bacterium]
MEPYRILLADDHVLFREAMRKAIGDTKGLAVVGGVDDGLELMEFLKHTRPDLIILDLTMPNLSGLEAAREIKKLYPEVKILILSMHKSKGCLKGAFWVGVNGYLLKEDAFQDLMSAIETIRSGKAYISPRLTDQMSDMYSQQETEERLTKQETIVLSLIAEYLTDEEICDRLFISIGTFRNHLFSIKNKLNIKTRPHLIKYGREMKGVD